MRGRDLVGSRRELAIDGEGLIETYDCNFESLDQPSLIRWPARDGSKRLRGHGGRRVNRRRLQWRGESEGNMKGCVQTGGAAETKSGSNTVIGLIVYIHGTRHVYKYRLQDKRFEVSLIRLVRGFSAHDAQHARKHMHTRIPIEEVSFRRRCCASRAPAKGISKVERQAGKSGKFVGMVIRENKEIYRRLREREDCETGTRGKTHLPPLPSSSSSSFFLYSPPFAREFCAFQRYSSE